MKGFIKSVSIILLLSLIFVSCNDSDQGLIQRAMEAQPNVSYKIQCIIGRNSDESLLYVATERGIYSLDKSGNFSYITLNGNNDMYTLYYDGEIHVYASDYNATEKKITIETLSTHEQTTILNGYSLVNRYSPDGVHFTYILEMNDKLVGLYIDKSTSTFNNITESNLKTGMGNNLAIVGSNVIRNYDKENKQYTYYNDGAKIDNIPADRYYWGYYNSIGAEGNGYIYRQGVDKNVGHDSSFNYDEPYSIIPIAQDGSLVIYPYSARAFSINGNESSSPTVSSLSSICVVSIIRNNKDSSKYLLISSTKGAYIYENGNISSIRGINFSDYIYE